MGSLDDWYSKEVYMNKFDRNGLSGDGPTDWEGHPIPMDESPDTVIQVWVIEPHIVSDYTEMIVRSWQEMLNFVRDIAEAQCEELTEDELRWVGAKLNIKLREMTKGEYDALSAVDD